MQRFLIFNGRQTGLARKKAWLNMYIFVMTICSCCVIFVFNIMYIWSERIFYIFLKKYIFPFHIIFFCIQCYYVYFMFKNFFCHLVVFIFFFILYVFCSVFKMLSLSSLTILCSYFPSLLQTHRVCIILFFSPESLYYTRHKAFYLNLRKQFINLFKERTTTFSKGRKEWNYKMKWPFENFNQIYQLFGNGYSNMFELMDNPF